MIKILTVLVALCGLIACNNSTNHNNQKESPIFDGGTDTGGSNEYYGKPLEAYIIDIKALPEYPQIQDVITELDKKAPLFSEIFKNSISNRTWYIIPGTLKHIPNHTIALPIAESSDQYALHTEKAIWLSKTKRDSLNDFDRAIHLMHEIIMAVRVDGNLLLRKINDIEFISKTEYDEIRSLAHLLIYKLNSYSDNTLNTYLKRNHFYRTHEVLDLIELHPNEAIPAGFLEFESIEYFYGISYRNRFSKSVSKYGYKPDPNKPPAYCTYDLTPFQKLTVKTFDKNGKKLTNTKNGRHDSWTGIDTLEFSEMIEYERKDQFLSIRFITKPTTTTTPQGLVSNAKMAHLFFIKDNLLYLEIFDAHKNSWQSSGGLWKDWNHTDIQDWYILCVNGNLK